MCALDMKNSKDMATLIDPFSSATAELSDEYINFFQNPDVVPKYLETICDQTGVQLLTGYSAISIKGSWVSVNTAHSFLTEFLTSYLNSEISKTQNGNVDLRLRHPSKGSDHCSLISDTDRETQDCQNEFQDISLKHAQEKRDGIVTGELSEWHKWASDVLPLIQRRRSKHVHIFNASKSNPQKAPEPLVLYADIQPVPHATAKKLPTLNDIERVLKKVYEKDKLISSATTCADANPFLVDESKHVVIQECQSIQQSKSQHSHCDKTLHPQKQEEGMHFPTVLPPSAKDWMVAEEDLVAPPGEVSKCLASLHNTQQSQEVIKLHTDVQNCRFQSKDVISSSMTDQNSHVETTVCPSEVGELDKQDTLVERSTNGKMSSVSMKGNSHFKTSVANNLPNRKCRALAQQIDGKAASLNRSTRRKGRPRKNTDYTMKRKAEGTSTQPKEGKADKVAKSKTKPVLVELNETPNDQNSVNDAAQLVLKKKRGRPSRPMPETKAEDNFTCDRCSFVTSKHSHLREHKRRVHITKEFKCEKCGKIFGFGKDLKRHRKTHQKPENCCSVCGKMYKGIRSLEEHKKTHAEGYIKPEFPCEFCSKIFSTKYVLAYHIKSDHLGMKRTYLCPTCGKSFSQKNSYLQHANVHMGIRPYQCDVCGKSFSYEKSLKEHRYMHEEDKQFECPVCKKKFRQSSGVAIHMKIHKERKDYVCSACGKGFSQKQALIRHERIHAGEKPFMCGVCKRNFTDSSILRRHMILIHKKDPKKWREDTVSNVSRRTDFFVSVLNEHEESAKGEPAGRGSSQMTRSEVVVMDSVNSENTGVREENEENSFKLTPAVLGSASQQLIIEDSEVVTSGLCDSTMAFDQTSPAMPSPLARAMSVPLRARSEESGIILHVTSNPVPPLNHEFGRDLIQPLDMSTPAQSQVYEQMGDSISADLPSLSAGSVLKFEDGSSQLPADHSRSVSVPLRSGLEEPVSVLPITHNSATSLPHMPLRDLTRPLDMSAPGHSLVSGHSGHLFSAFGFGDHHLPPSDLYTSEAQVLPPGLQMPYSSMLTHGSIAGYYQSPMVMVPETASNGTYHAGTTCVSSASEMSLRAKYEQMTSSPAMQQVQYSPSSTPQL